MSLLSRITAKVYGSGLAPSSDHSMTTFGTAKAATPTYSNDPAAIQTAQWLLGLAATLASGQAPYMQDVNGVWFVLSYLISYLYQAGIAEWDAGTNYALGSFCRGPSTGNLFVSQQTNNLNHAVTDTNWWLPYEQTITAPGIAKAWVVFNGISISSTPCTILSSFNVTSVTKVSAGVYEVNFTNALPVDGSGNGLYGFSGSCGTANGAAAVNGDNNIICAFYGGHKGLKTATKCRITAWESTGGLEDSGCISVLFFG